MRTTSIFFIVCAFLLFANCTGKAKQSLPDELPQQSENDYVLLNTDISPPPPGKTDKNDTISVIDSEKISPSDKVYEVLDIDFLPSYPDGGWGSFSRYIQSVRYPKEVTEKETKGYLAVVFVVEKDGSISNIELIHSVDKLIDNEIVKALQNMSPWKPGKKNGLYVRAKYGFTLVFE